MAEKLKIYYSKTDDMNKWAEEGFDLIPNDPFFGVMMLYKTIKIPEDDKFVKAVVSNYKNPEMQKYFRNKFTEDYLHSIGVNFYKDENSLILDEDNEKFKETITTLRFEIFPDDEDRICALAPFDLSFPNKIYSAKLIRPYLSGDIERWERLGMLGHKFMGKTA